MQENIKYWMIVASKDHVKKGISEGIAQACHGKIAPLKRMKKGDYIIYYSGKEKMDQSLKCQKFTAIGRVLDDDSYLFPVSEDFCRARRNIDFFDCKETSILPLINDLDFIQNKQSWGYPFRFGFFEINQHDFDLISSKMCEN